MRTFFAVAALSPFLAGSLIADEPKPATLVITGGLIRTQTEAGEFVGTIVIRDGKIVAVGRDVAVPAGATVIEASKCVITPGLIDAHGTLGLNPAALNESGREAALNILDAVDPFSGDWRDAARQGITAVYVQPAGNNNLGGAGAVLRVCSGDCADSLSLRSPAGVQLALGLTPSAPAAQADQGQRFGRRGGLPPPVVTQPPSTPPVSNSLTRFSQYEQVHGQFEAARKYGADKPARREAPKELLLRAIKSEVPVRIEVRHEDDVRNALKLADEFNLTAAFERIERVRHVPDEFRTRRAAIIIGPLLGGRPSSEIRKLALDGRRFAIGTFGSDNRASVGLRLHAAAAVAAGYPRDRVLRAMTSDAADVLGAGDKLGRIAVGRIADLAVFAGDPLDPSAPVRLSISQGAITYDAPVAEPALMPIATKAALPEKLPSSYVIKTTRLLNASGQFAPGELHVVAGRLAARNVNGPSLPVFDLGDAIVTPGLVAAHVPVAGEASPDADAAEWKATDGLAPDDGRLRACRDAGFVTAIAAPGSNNVIAGITGIVRADGTRDIGMKFVLTASARNRERYPVSLAGQVALIDSRLRLAVADTNLYLPPAVRNALLAQRDRTMQAVRDRRLAAVFEAQTRAEIRAALRLIAEHKLRGVLLMPREVDELADEIRQASVAVIVGPLRPQDPERVLRGLVALGKAGIPLAFAGNAGEIRTSAAMLVNAGLMRQTARAALLDASLAGHQADFVVWTGDPLDTTSQPSVVVVQGQRVATGAAQTAPMISATPGAPARTGRRGR